MYWWGVSIGVVWRWRKALGVTRTNNEGSQRLIQAAAELGAAAAKERGLTDEECDEHSRRSLELGLGRYLKTGYHGPRWTREQLRLLGKEPDDVVAGKVGRTPNAVRLMRQRLGIPNPAPADARAGRPSRTTWSGACRLGRWCGAPAGRFTRCVAGVACSRGRAGQGQNPPLRRGRPEGRSCHPVGCSPSTGGQAMSTTVDACFARLHAAGWSIGDVRLLGTRGPLLLVTGTCGDHFIGAEGLTQTEAWQNACELAQAAGLMSAGENE
jgi:hypothetical protein